MAETSKIPRRWTTFASLIVFLMILLLAIEIAIPPSNSKTIADLNNQLNRANGEIRFLNETLYHLEEPNTHGVFNFTTSGCPTMNCTYQITGALASFGTKALGGDPSYNTLISNNCIPNPSPNSCGVVLVFFLIAGPGPQAGGILCQTPYYDLGIIRGQMIISWSSTCNSTVNTPAKFLNVELHWKVID